MAVGTFPWASWRASDRSRRIAVFIVAPPCDGATMPRAGGHRQDGEARGLTILERWLAARNPSPPGSSPTPQPRRVRDYLLSYEFWINGVVFFLFGLGVKCHWFKW